MYNSRVSGKVPDAHLNEVNLFLPYLNIKELEVESPLRWFLCISDVSLTYGLGIFSTFIFKPNFNAVSGDKSPFLAFKLTCTRPDLKGGKDVVIHVLTFCPNILYENMWFCCFFQTRQTQDPHEEAHR